MSPGQSLQHITQDDHSADEPNLCSDEDGKDVVTKVWSGGSSS